MSTHDEGFDLTESDQETAGDMGVSSERVGATGPGQHGTSGTRYVGPLVRQSGERPEQSRGGVEPSPDAPTPPVGGYPKHHPLSGEHPYRKGRRR